MRTRLFCVLTISIALSGMGGARLLADEALYDPAPPANSAFLRLISASETAAGAGAIAGNDVNLGEFNVSDYVVVPGGKSAVELGGKNAEIDCPTGKYCSVLFDISGGAAPVVIVDEVLENPAKSGLHFYNLTDQPALTLSAPDQGVDLFKDVPSGGMQFRQVGAVTVNLSVKAAEAEIAKIQGAALKRRTGHSVVVRGNGEKASAALVENTVSK